MKDITYQPAARKALRKMPLKTRRRIIGKIETYATDPASQKNNIKRLQGSDELRLRIGDYRVIFLDSTIIDVLKIGPRGSIYGDQR